MWELQVKSIESSSWAHRLEPFYAWCFVQAATHFLLYVFVHVTSCPGCRWAVLPVTFFLHAINTWRETSERLNSRTPGNTLAEKYKFSVYINIPIKTAFLLFAFSRTWRYVFFSERRKRRHRCRKTVHKRSYRRCFVFYNDGLEFSWLQIMTK